MQQLNNSTHVNHSTLSNSRATTRSRLRSRLLEARANRSNPFRLEITRARALRPLKRALVALGQSGRRVDFEFVRRVFAEIPELRSA
jgi:hypothetical protein